MTVAVTLFALLELYKQGELSWTQDEPFGEITSFRAARARGRRAARSRARNERARARRSRRCCSCRADPLERSRRWPAPAEREIRATLEGGARSCGGSYESAARAQLRARRGLRARPRPGRRGGGAAPVRAPRTPPLTPAQAETLAIIAYLQPVSRPEIARIRGVNAESAASTLLERGMIEEAGRSQFGAVLYRTTELFLRLFGLQSLDDLADLSSSSPLPRLSRSCAGGCCARAKRGRELNPVASCTASEALAINFRTYTPRKRGVYVEVRLGVAESGPDADGHRGVTH